MSEWRMEVGQELPALPLVWLASDGSVIDFSTGWTFTVKISAASAPTTTLVTKTSGITGAATSPNVTIDWSTSELSGLMVSPLGSLFVVRVSARRTADDKDRVFNPGNPLKLRLFPASS